MNAVGIHKRIGCLTDRVPEGLSHMWSIPWKSAAFAHEQGTLIICFRIELVQILLGHCADAARTSVIFCVEGFIHLPSRPGKEEGRKDTGLRDARRRLPRPRARAQGSGRDPLGGL